MPLQPHLKRGWEKESESFKNLGVLWMVLKILLYSLPFSQTKQCGISALISFSDKLYLSPYSMWWHVFPSSSFQNHWIPHLLAVVERNMYFLASCILSFIPVLLLGTLTSKCIIILWKTNVLGCWITGSLFLIFFFFFRAVLEPLLSLTPPAHSVFIVVDSVDSGCCGGNGVGEGSILGSAGTQSSSIAELLLKHIQLFPPWILLVCSARRQNKAVCKMFSGIQKDDSHTIS